MSEPPAGAADGIAPLSDAVEPAPSITLRALPLSSAVSGEAALQHLPAAGEQREIFCARKHQDVVSERLCAAGEIKSLADLQAAIGLPFTSPVGNGDLGNPAFAFLSHTTSLAGRHVSPINPRVIIFSDPASKGPLAGAPVPDPDFVAMAFSRGEPLAEIVTRDRETKELRFFLVRFELACEGEGCSQRDLFGPAVEKNWQNVSVYDGDDLANTAFDCNVCHQPGGPDSPRMLRMTERRAPWTHFFRSREEGKDLIADYFSAHDVHEVYGGVPGELVTWSEPARLQGLIENEGFGTQPGELPTRELAYLSLHGQEPAELPEYARLLDRAQRGQGLPVPFPGARFADPIKLRKGALAYKAKSADLLGTSQVALGDLHSEEASWRVGLKPAPASAGASLVVQMCSRCHNGELDSSLSRARFDATRLDAMSPAALALAVERMRLPASSPLKMPPARFGELTPEQVEDAARALGVVPTVRYEAP